MARPARSRFAYLAATETVATKPYALLRQALERSSKVAVAKFAQRDRERLGLLRVKGPTTIPGPIGEGGVIPACTGSRFQRPGLAG